MLSEQFLSSFRSSETKSAHLKSSLLAATTLKEVAHVCT